MFNTHATPIPLKFEVQVKLRNMGFKGDEYHLTKERNRVYLSHGFSF